VARRAVGEPHAGQHVHLPRRVRVQLDGWIVGDVREVEDRVVATEVQLVDPADVEPADVEPRVWREVVAEPHRIDDVDLVRRPLQQRLGQARPDITASARDEDLQMAPPQYRDRYSSSQW
jgi:hypothetical protein